MYKRQGHGRAATLDLARLGQRQHAPVAPDVAHTRFLDVYKRQVLAWRHKRARLRASASPTSVGSRRTLQEAMSPVRRPAYPQGLMPRNGARSIATFSDTP